MIADVISNLLGLKIDEVRITESDERECFLKTENNLVKLTELCENDEDLLFKIEDGICYIDPERGIIRSTRSKNSHYPLKTKTRLHYEKLLAWNAFFLGLLFDEKPGTFTNFYRKVPLKDLTSLQSLDTISNDEQRAILKGLFMLAESHSNEKPNYEHVLLNNIVEFYQRKRGDFLNVTSTEVIELANKLRNDSNNVLENNCTPLEVLNLVLYLLYTFCLKISLGIEHAIGSAKVIISFCVDFDILNQDAGAVGLPIFNVLTTCCLNTNFRKQRALANKIKRAKIYPSWLHQMDLYQFYMAIKNNEYADAGRQIGLSDFPNNQSSIFVPFVLAEKEGSLFYPIVIAGIMYKLLIKKHKSLSPKGGSKKLREYFDIFYSVITKYGEFITDVCEMREYRPILPKEAETFLEFNSVEILEAVKILSKEFNPGIINVT